MTDGDSGDRVRKTAGEPVARREDEALLTGRAEYTDDLDRPGTVHLVFVRSDHGHARIEGIDTEAAAELEGVLGAYTWADLEASESPCVLSISSSALDCEPPGHPVLARDRVRYQGQPIAAVVAEDRYIARDAAEAVEIEYEPLEAVVDPVGATDDGAPTIFEEAPDNVALTAELGDRGETDRAFEAADRVVDIELVNNRLISSAIEPRAALASYDPAERRFTVEMTSQSPHGHRRDLSHTLGVPERELRVIAPRVGGGFGHKGHHHPGEAMAAWAARELERPVKWVATRSGNYLEGAHGRDHVTRGELAVDDDGSLRGLRVETHAGVGGYGLGGGPAMPGWYGRLLSSQYEIPAIHCETRAVFTNTAPVHSYRGAGRPEAIYVTERLVDVAARELGIDPVELRRRNQLPSDAFPHETPVGSEYDSGDYARALEAALDAVSYDDLRAEIDAEREGRDDELPQTLRGVGVANYVESTGGGFESGVVRVHPDGGVTVSAGTHSHGQGHGTTYAQLVADVLELPMAEIDVHEGDTDRVPKGTGTFGSRSTITGGNAVVESAEMVLEKARRVAAHELEANPDELAYESGEFRLEGDAERTIPFADVASAAYGRGLPDGVEPGLEATTFYEPDGTAYTFGTHVAVVSIDSRTGELEIERYVAVDDCGERINPTIVEGQVHGGVAQGLGQARYEEAVYDDDGTLLTDSLETYAVPRAEDLPEIETDATVTPSPRNPLGVKGIGEAGTIAAPPALVNAVVDALEPVSVDHVDMPLTDERLWRAIHGEPSTE
ncbi:xanthine dehydrogenase family protein molybdopterin-binding subunit [Natrononativus amylolyticus]|uniref:xanthine dehydrogenase family protein molybdopterin-binding subunit n=1 Tax=Natrononativus amylolyticus TaxID=2963434 RepID=UPI0020CCB0F7|nr:xanthine dehydrogenase family protein molybdopterin-binding subunit [Natrononativus amylolyticus]